MQRFACVTLLSGVFLSAACSKRVEEPATLDAAPPAAAAVAPSLSASATPPGAASSGLGVTLAERLASEARSRPAIRPTADDVLAALEKAGSGVVAKKQGLGATYRASFCEGGTTADGALTLSVCEYADDAAAKLGLAALQSIYPAKSARHVLHKQTVLTTLRLKDGAAAEALEARLASAYQAL